jgi:hypothetical protein
MTRYRLILLAVLLMAVGCGQSSSPSEPPTPITRAYSTHFPLTENPLSEGGNWIDGLAVGLDWSNVHTRPGLAFASHANGTYDDSIVIVTGTWAHDQ